MLNEAILIATVAFIIGFMVCYACVTYGVTRVVCTIVGVVCMLAMCIMAMATYVWCTDGGAQGWDKVWVALVMVFMVLIGMGMLHGMVSSARDHEATMARYTRTTPRVCKAVVDGEYTTYGDDEYHTGMMYPVYGTRDEA